MPEKLTLRLDQNLIAGAKSYAKEHGRSVSQLVADYFSQLTVAGAASAPPKRGSVTAKLRGALKGAEIDQTDYRRHLEEKYR